MPCSLTREQKIKIVEIKRSLEDIKKRVAVLEALGSLWTSVCPTDDKEMNACWEQIASLSRDIIEDVAFAK